MTRGFAESSGAMTRPASAGTLSNGMRSVVTVASLSRLGSPTPTRFAAPSVCAPMPACERAHRVPHVLTQDLPMLGQRVGDDVGHRGECDPQRSEGAGVPPHALGE